LGAPAIFRGDGAKITEESQKVHSLSTLLPQFFHSQ